MPKRKIETHTAASPKPKSGIKKEPVDPVKALLEKLYSLAIDDGNTTAAKLYLDYTLKQQSDEPGGLTPDEALKILQQQSPA